MFINTLMTVSCIISNNFEKLIVLRASRLIHVLKLKFLRSFFAYCAYQPHALQIQGGVHRRLNRLCNKERGRNNFPILISPKNLTTKTPTWNNIRKYFRNVHLSLITRGTKVSWSALKGITSGHRQMLDLMKVPDKVFDNLRDK